MVWAWWLPGLDMSLRAIGAVVTEVLLTGGMHWDGWADIFDGWGAPPERREVARKDSRVGTMGVLFLIVGFGALVQLWRLDASPFHWPVFFLSPLIARGVISVATAVSHPSPHSQLATWFRSVVDLRGAAVSAVLVVGVTLALMGPRGLVADGIVAAAAAAFVRYWTKMFSGMNGDILGATVIFTELTVLLVGAWGWIWR